MKKLIKFSALTKFMAVASAVIAVVGIVMLLIFSGETTPEFTFVNLGWGLVLRTLVAAVLTVALTTAYLLICYGKKGFTMGLTSAFGAVISAVCAFAFCVICRAPLSDFTFPVMLLGVFVSYISSVIFFRSFGTDKPKGKQFSVDVAFETAANKAFVPLLVMLLLITLVAVGAFAVALFLKSSALCLYVLPVILTAIFSVLVTLSFTCNIYAKKA